MQTANDTAVRPWRGEPAPYLRWAVRDPTGKESWKLHACETLDDEACAQAGLNVIGPALVASGLSGLERQVLVRYSRTKQGEEQAKAILSGMPRATVHGYDVDVRDDLKGTDSGEAAVEALAAIVRSVEAPRVLRESYSAGLPGRGRHLEFGPVEEDGRRPGLSRTMLRRCAELLERAGLVRCSKVAWTLPKWQAEAERTRGAPPAVVDLRRMNHDPASREGILRPLGGKYKDGGLRKALCPWSVLPPDPVTKAELDAAPPEPREDRVTPRRRGPRATLADLPQASALPEFEAAVAKDYRPGDNHDDLRLAGMGVLYKSGLVRPDWAIRALGRGTRDVEDAREAWRTTKARVDKGERCYGLPTLRKRIGAARLEAWAHALWRELARRGSRVTLPEVRDRFGLRSIRSGWELAAAALAVGAPGEEAKVTAKRLRLLVKAQNAPRCGHLAYRWSACTTCGKVGCWCPIRCRFLEVCASCVHAWARACVEHVAWPERTSLGRGTFQSKKEAEHYASVLRRSPDKQAMTLISPGGVDGEWEVTAYAPVGSQAAVSLTYLRRDGSPVLTEREVAGPVVAAGWVYRALLGRHVWVQELLARNELAKARDLILELHRHHVVRPPRDPAIRWPSQAEVRAIRQETIREREPGPDEEPDCDDCESSREREGLEVGVPATGEVLKRRVKFAPTFARACRIAEESEVSARRTSA